MQSKLGHLIQRRRPSQFLKSIEWINEPVNKQSVWRIRTNLIINDNLKGKDIMMHTKSLRLILLGYVDRLERGRTPKCWMQRQIIEQRNRKFKKMDSRLN